MLKVHAAAYLANSITAPGDVTGRGMGETLIYRSRKGKLECIETISDRGREKIQIGKLNAAHGRVDGLLQGLESTSIDGREVGERQNGRLSSIIIIIRPICHSPRHIACQAVRVSALGASLICNAQSIFVMVHRRSSTTCK